jgi:hypothetical protein
VGVLKKEMPTLVAITFFEMSPTLFQNFPMILAGYQREKQGKKSEEIFMLY